MPYAYLFDRPMKLEEGEKGLRNWIHMFSESLLRALSQEDQQKLLASVEEKLRGQLFRDGDWFADYRR